ncbi:MAG: glycosyltransferase family 2 protein, partial [Chloroflexota bacterium]
GISRPASQDIRSRRRPTRPMQRGIIGHTMGPIRFSVVIPSYNVANYIGDTIDSVLSQDYPHKECVVVDGGSTDGTLEVLRRYGGRVRWTSEPDKGQSDAINRGLRRSSGDVVTYICADDVYEPGCLSAVADAFSRNPDSKWLFGKCRIINTTGREVRRYLTAYKEFWQARYSYSKLLMLDFIAQPAVFWRREVVDELGLLDVSEHLAMDYEYWLRMGANYEPLFVDQYLAAFRVHPGSKSAVGYSRQARDALRVARRYSGGRKAGMLLPLQCFTYCSTVATYSVLDFGSRIRERLSERHNGAGECT